MTAKELSQYKSAKAEIKSIHKELQELPDYIEGTDTVKGSSPEYPYTEHPVTIRGLIPNPRKEKLQQRLRRLERLIFDVDEFMDGIEDVNTARAIRLHYINGQEWWKVAETINCSVTGDAFRKKVKRFLKVSVLSALSVLSVLEL